MRLFYLLINHKNLFKEYVMVRIVSLVLTIAAVFAISSSSYADSTGCGLGTQLWEGKSGLFANICAVTTNGTSGNQTFGITSGTSGCNSGDAVALNERLEKFVASNMDNLATDIAKGNGEYLDSLSTLMEVDEKNKTAFNNKLKNNFSRIYTSNSVTSHEVINNIMMVTKS
jgi:hypothetical protein